MSAAQWAPYEFVERKDGIHLDIEVRLGVLGFCDRADQGLLRVNWKAHRGIRRSLHARRVPLLTVDETLLRGDAAHITLDAERLCWYPTDESSIARPPISQQRASVC